MIDFNLFSKTHKFSIPIANLNLDAGLYTDAKDISIQKINTYEYKGVITTGIKNISIYTSIHIKEKEDQYQIIMTSSVSSYQKLSLVFLILVVFYFPIQEAIKGNWPWGILFLSPLFASMFLLIGWGVFNMHLEESFQKYKKMLTAPSPF